MILCLFFVDMGNWMTGFCARLKMGKLYFQPIVNWGVKSIYYNIYFRLMKPVIFFICRGIYQQVYLSTYADRPYKGRALLAGFCEIGETPEQTVVREVQEEVGLHVKNIRYFDSQPWGFDSNLLLGYYCEVDGGTSITMDETELATARFVKRDKIEEDKNLLSLTATMIDRFRKGLE